MEEELTAGMVAQELGLSQRTVTQHATDAETRSPSQLRGRRVIWGSRAYWVFARSEVERFKRERRPAHRPRLNPDA